MPDPSPGAPALDAEGRSVILLPIDPGLSCLRGLSPRRLRFEVEYGLERGTSANSFLFAAGSTAEGLPVPPVLVHPPGASFAAPYLAALAELVPAEAPLKVVVGHVNPNRVALLRQLAAQWPALMLVASNAGARLLRDLWNQQKPGSGVGGSAVGGAGTGPASLQATPGPAGEPAPCRPCPRSMW